MANEIKKVIKKTLIRSDKQDPKVSAILTPEEKILRSYGVFGDSVTFTDKRIIFLDYQLKFMKNKTEIYSLPYSSILGWSTEDGLTKNELELWTRIGDIKLKIVSLDIWELNNFLSNHILK